jgi:hypothetical protein
MARSAAWRVLLHGMCFCMARSAAWHVCFMMASSTHTLALHECDGVGRGVSSSPGGGLWLALRAPLRAP